jgi:hypothetical protein
MTDSGSRKSENREQMAEDRGQITEVGSGNAEVGKKEGEKMGR